MAPLLDDMIYTRALNAVKNILLMQIDLYISKRNVPDPDVYYLGKLRMNIIHIAFMHSLTILNNNGVYEIEECMPSSKTVHEVNW